MIRTDMMARPTLGWQGALARSGDLVAAVALGGLLVFLLAAEAGGPLAGAFRLVVGLAFVLYVPGYCIFEALLPRPRALDRVERIGISIGASVAVIPILALILDLLPWGLRPWPVVLGEMAVTVLFAAIALWQRTRREAVPEERAPGTGHWWPTASLAQLTRFERFAYPAVVVAAVGALAMLVGMLVVPSGEDLMTEMYVLGRGGLAEQLPRVVAVGEVVSVTLGIVNRERGARTYRVEAWATDAWNPGAPELLVPPMSVSVARGERLEWPMSWQMPYAGPDQSIDLVLFMDGNSQPYRRLRLWVDVEAPTTAGAGAGADVAGRPSPRGIEADLAPPAQATPAPAPVPRTEHLPVSVPVPALNGQPGQADPTRDAPR